jgi:WD40 repeat protein
LSFANSFQAHSKGIWQIKPSPFNNDYVATCSEDNTVKIWNNFDWTIIHTSSGVTELEWLDKYTLASAKFYSGEVIIRSIITGQIKRTITTNRRVDSVKFLNNKIHLAVGVFDDIYIYNINNGNLVSSFKGYLFQFNDLIEISDNLLACSGWDNSVRIWNFFSNTFKFNLTGHTGYVSSLKQINPNILASGSYDGTIKLWNIASGQLIRTLTGHTSVIHASIDLLNPQTLVSGSINGEIKLWNWSTGKCLSTIQTNSEIESLAVLNSVEGKRYNHFSIYYY